jgi:hypothetical protein
MNKRVKKEVIKQCEEGAEGLEDEKLFDEKCERCPVFHLLFRHDKLCGSVMFVDKLMATAIEMCHNRVGTSLGADPLISRVFDSLSSPAFAKDLPMKVAALFMCMVLQPEVIEYIRSFYVAESRELQRFEDMLPYVLSRARDLLFGHVSIYTTPSEIETFVMCVVIPTYLCGPPVAASGRDVIKK